MAKKQEIAELVAPDPFVEHANAYAGWVEKNLKLLIGGVVGVLALIGVGLFIQQSGERTASSLTAELTKAVHSYSEATDLKKTMTSTNPAQLQAELEKSVGPFSELAKKKPGTGAGMLAELYQADLERRLGHMDRAEGLYKGYVEHARSGDPLMFLALEGAGYALEDQGKLDEALGFYNRLIDLPGKFYEDYGLKHKARILEQKGDTAGALAAYKAIAALPESKLHDFAEERVSALE